MQRKGIGHKLYNIIDALSLQKHNIKRFKVKNGKHTKLTHTCFNVNKRERERERERENKQKITFDREFSRVKSGRFNYMILKKAWTWLFLQENEADGE